MTVRQIRVEELHLGTTGAVLLDVRATDEYAAGHLPGAVNLPLDDLPAAATRYAGQDVVTVCRSGARSVTAARLLAAAGARVQSLAGGTDAWRRAGHPIETGH
ncbi:rhodanese-like domain-containing protein [Actinoplanes sp. NPDC026670]|uniref:rhodanese-like domain-containing protein n=1 Tax=Actinoplanes sp. NPDC026670 TaxID=3154700 RepID=UPI0033D21AA5